jgi:PAS domain S-box-containing protein
MVLDVSMPGMDGLEALPGILEASPTTRVVMLSGFGGSALELAARTVGAADFVEKAAPIRDLPGRLLRLLDVPVDEDEGSDQDRGSDPDSQAPADRFPQAADQATPPTSPPPTSPPPTSPPQTAPALPTHEEDEASQASEAVLAEHLERFRTVFDQAAIGMATMTLSGTIVRANEALVQTFGKTETALAGQPYIDLAGPDTVEAVQEAISGVAAGKVDAAKVEHSLGAGDDVRWLHATFAAVRDSVDRPLYLFAQVEDVTRPRKAAEELRQSEERLRLLVEAVQDYAIFMLDPQGFVTTWNVGAERMKGYRADEIIGHHFRAFYPDDARSSRHPERELELAVEAGRYKEEGWRIRKDGTRFWANVVITALFDREGRHIGFGKVTRDITERRIAAQASERATADLSDANRLLRSAAERTAEFLAITAHELQSPIATVTGAADILLEHWNRLDETERRETLDSLTRGAARLRRLLEDLLLASRLEAGSFQFSIEDVALRSAIAEALAALPEPATPVQVGCPDDLVARADPTRVVQIILNLVANADKYGTPPVRIQARRTGPAIEVRVHDDGAGVPSEFEPQLFQKFSRAPGRRDRGTGGLGLFIVRELARGQGGEAWYEPDEASGHTCFVFSLPAKGA